MRQGFFGFGDGFQGVIAPVGNITPHFTWEEFRCHCCHRVSSIAEARATAEWMERVRHEVYDGRPIRVNCSCRCQTHNRDVGGASRSQHLLGKAVDHTVIGLTVPQEWSRCAAHQGPGRLIGGLGRYSVFTHVDRGSPRRWEGP